MARPTTFDPRIADAVVEAVAGGASIQAACDAAGVGRTSFLTWVGADRAMLKERLERARAGQGARACVAPEPQNEQVSLLPAPVAADKSLVLTWTFTSTLELNPAARLFLAGLVGVLLSEIKKRRHP